MLALADDSGLEVEALGGQPGIHSARWGGPDRDFDLAMARVHEELEATGGAYRRANFTCALALAAPNGEEIVTIGQGVWGDRLAAEGLARLRLRSYLHA